jgi:hypothetical protein
LEQKTVSQAEAAPPASSMKIWLVIALVGGLLAVAVIAFLRSSGSPVPTEPPASVRPSPRGWQIRYNATLALCVKGSKHVPLGELLEMLDENKQLRNFRVKQSDGHDVPDETGARKTVLNALKAVAAWHEKLDVPKAYGPDNQKLKKVYAAITNLADHSPNPVVRQEAERTRRLLRRG